MKIPETSFDDIYNYINNNLSKKKMIEVEQSIIKNGETELVYHSMMFDYQQNRDYIESLIGADEEEIKKIQPQPVRILQKTSL